MSPIQTAGHEQNSSQQTSGSSKSEKGEAESANGMTRRQD